MGISLKVYVTVPTEFELVYSEGSSFSCLFVLKETVDEICLWKSKSLRTDLTFTFTQIIYMSVYM